VLALTTLKKLGFDEALQLVGDGAAFVDLRPIDEYLDVHIPGSIPLLYENGPGMAARARDCIPLSLELIISEPPGLAEDEVANAAASLRGKGFTVAGKVADAINGWVKTRATPASTELFEGVDPPVGTLLAVGDPGAQVRSEALHIPVETLWSKIHDVPRGQTVVVTAGFGVRAALAIGILELHGLTDVAVWRRPLTDRVSPLRGPSR
jgi:rhodanese-related sulfurtransferase